MSFETEWAELKSRAEERTRARADAATRLNSLDPASSSSGDLVACQDDLGAVGHEAYVLHGEVKKAADVSRGRDGGATERAASELAGHHLPLGHEMGTTLAVWETQVKTVLQMCAHISNHLDYSKRQHQHDDAAIGASLRHRDGSAVSVSELSTYVH
ncbi:hypothetical protein [Streptomyces sp. NPDC050560]|uniref:hypothetical protein n=1 Tax=Streptomyces sp. NPDC050560 TaxID=3365630 RepID=UPI0037A3F321